MPDGCIRIAQKFRLPQGDLMIAQKNYEKASGNTGYTTELYFCDDFQDGNWYSAYEWDALESATITYFPQIVSDGTKKFFIHDEYIKDELGNEKTCTTIIMDIKEVDIVAWSN